MNREQTPNKKYLNYLDVLRLRNKQQLNKSEKSENYHRKSLPLWTKLRSNNTKIISNATNEKLVNTTMKSGLGQMRSTSLSYQNSNSLRLTPPKSSTYTTKEQRIAAYMGEQQLKSLSSSLPSNQESLQQKKPTNFWMKRWIQRKQHDEDAKDYATRALRLPPSLKHLEAKESGSKREAFREEFIAKYNEANYQQRVLEQQSPVHQVEEVVEDTSRLQLGTVIEEDVDFMDVGPRPSTTTVITTIPTVQQTIQHRERPTSNTTHITIFSTTSSIIASSSTTNIINPYYNFNNQLYHSLRWHSTGQSPTTLLPYWRTITNHPRPLSVIQNDDKIQFTKKPIPWRNEKKTTTVEDQHHINESVQKFLDGRMIEVSPTQLPRFLSKFFTLQETTKRRPILDCQKLNSFIQVEHFKMEGVPARRELMEKDDYICKIDLKDAYVVVPIHVDSQNFLSFENKGTVYRYKSLAFGHSVAPRVFSKIMRYAIESLRRNSHHLLFGRYLHPDKDETRDGPGAFGLCVQQQSGDDISTIFEDYQPNEENSTVAYFSKENVQMDSRSTREDDFHNSSSRRSSITHKIPTTGPVENIAPDSPELGSNLQIVKYEPSGVTLVGNLQNTKEWSSNPKDSSREPKDDHSPHTEESLEDKTTPSITLKPSELYLCKFPLFEKKLGAYAAITEDIETRLNSDSSDTGLAANLFVGCLICVENLIVCCVTIEVYNREFSNDVHAERFKISYPELIDRDDRYYEGIKTLVIEEKKRQANHEEANDWDNTV
ncbi:hypothetical protein G6F37_001570 [Rhizopus arrhizus]|nr:hypothetical protein G6F38_000204 [Rhizopus arrhizus]KAG1163061.1 hypothetical protein G6F37_001570 [Rhizopus arrhizus]